MSFESKTGQDRPLLLRWKWSRWSGLATLWATAVGNGDDAWIGAAEALAVAVSVPCELAPARLHCTPGENHIELSQA